MGSDQATEIFSNSRRNFIKMAAAGSAVASALSAASATTAQEAAVRLPENESGPYDLEIAGGRCIDPETGLDAVRNVGIKVDASRQSRITSTTYSQRIISLRKEVL